MFLGQLPPLDLVCFSASKTHENLGSNSCENPKTASKTHMKVLDLPPKTQLPIPSPSSENHESAIYHENYCNYFILFVYHIPLIRLLVTSSKKIYCFPFRLLIYPTIF